MASMAAKENENVNVAAIWPGGNGASWLKAALSVISYAVSKA
jgi:hypothetical protein